MIEAMGGDHERAAAESNEHFYSVGWKSITEPGRSGNAAQTAKHQGENGSPTMFTESHQQRDGAEESNQQSQATVNAFFRRKDMREHCRG